MALLIKVLKRVVPAPLKRLLLAAKRLLIYRQYDSSAYWRSRAGEAGQAKVLWQNEAYNHCYREVQQKILDDFLDTLPPRAHILDIGCGSGVVAAMIDDGRRRIDAVDFEEMITVARRENPSPNVHYISSSAEDYYDAAKSYDAVISSACFSAIRHLPSLRQAVANCANMVAADGRLLMIDPFHRWNFLARAKFGSRQVQHLMQQLGFRLSVRSGVLFWPYRELLANSVLPEVQIRKRFAAGERWLSRLGRHLWADYKVLIFDRSDEKTV